MRKGLLYFVLVLQVFVLGGIAASHYMTLQLGERIVLETEPIDPRDLFHGDYVILNYDVSTLSTNLIEEGTELDERDRIYVILEQSDSVSKAVRIVKTKPELKDGQVALKGIVRYIDSYQRNVRIDYGLERYYIEEGTGASYERDPADKVAIRVSSWGQSTIEELIYSQ
ncbi:GDYXXLXY domain-containing protein [Pseudalkalibacillus sp. SCS-8]|uniref:GDYXXLXY domain-containing protein n=1 Tax=Pseudalkalibacillus nanhaiensis TaxID=3115291 RepID=UPI0032DA607C